MDLCPGLAISQLFVLSVQLTVHHIIFCGFFFLESETGHLSASRFSAPTLRLQVFILLQLSGQHSHGPCWYRVTHSIASSEFSGHHCILSSTTRPSQFYYIQSCKPMIRFSFNSFLIYRQIPLDRPTLKWCSHCSCQRGLHDPLFSFGATLFDFLSSWNET